MSRYNPPRQAPEPIGKKQPVAIDNSVEANAMWRIPQWYPKFSPAVLEMLKVYHVELLKFNAKVNLISRSTELQADEAHFADSILASEVIMKAVPATQPVMDLGSGSGLPGVVLALLDPKRQVNLVESDARKAEFLKHIVARLQLKNAKVMNVRLETLKPTEFGVMMTRAVASIAKLLLAYNRIVPKGTAIYHLKGNNWSGEIAELPSQLLSFWKPELVGEYTLPATQARRAIVCTKKSQ